MEEAEIIAGLATDAPGYYIWSAKLLGKCDYLKPLLTSPDKHARYHGALALALLDDSSAATVEVLCSCALETDGFRPTSGRKYVYPRSVSAIYALGRIGSPLALPVLYQLLEETPSIPFQPDQLLTDQGDVEFQYHSHTVAALLEIAKAVPTEREAIFRKLAAALDADPLSVSLMGGPLRAEYRESFRKLLDM